MQYSPDMSQLMQMAKSKAGQQLIALLQNTGGDALQGIISQASSGDYAGAKEALSALLSTPEAQELLRQMEESK